MIFVALWVTFDYAPMAHMVWNGGLLSADGAISKAIGAAAHDFAGGTVVHINAAVAALIIVLIIGKRKGFGTQPFRPHNVPFVMLSLPAVVRLVRLQRWFRLRRQRYCWLRLGFHLRRHRSRNALLGLHREDSLRSLHRHGCRLGYGRRPGRHHPGRRCGFPLWAIVMGAIAGVLTCLACGLKFKFGYDDSLDVVGVHGVGGFTGTILIGFFGEGTGLLAGGDWKQLVVQLVIALVAILYSAVITAIIAFALEKTIGWRVTEAQEVGGIDLADQGERAYDFAGTASSVLKEVK